jgi:hypothetical protein
MIISLTTIVCLALICITCLEIFCPAGAATQTIVIMISFLTPTVGQILNIYKTEEGTNATKENRKSIEDIKIATDGQTEHAVAQAANLATLTEQVESARKAAEVAAHTTAATAAALLKKDG